MARDAPALPVEGCLEELKLRLSERDEVLLQAPPGAGKTTLVPPALLAEPWLSDRKILMLEPRRIATRAAAYRMAGLLGEPVGRTVGYRMRLESKTGPQTRIEIVTEGVMSRMLQQDPSLEGIGLVIFDEFHERHLESDLALALCLKGRALFRGDNGDKLKLLVMSATLDSHNVADLLQDAPIVESAGRLYPVDIVYGRARKADDRIVDRTVACIRQALEDNPGQQPARFPARPGRDSSYQRGTRRLAAYPADHRHAPASALRQPVAGRAATGHRTACRPAGRRSQGRARDQYRRDQPHHRRCRRGGRFGPRAGCPLQPGNRHDRPAYRKDLRPHPARSARAVPVACGQASCYRLWSQEQQKQLARHTAPEILQADLAPLALQLLDWGSIEPGRAELADPPPRAHWRQALDLLELLGALQGESDKPVLGPHGRSMATLPVHPRLAHLLLRGAAIGFTVTEAALLASLLSERDPLAGDNRISARASSC